MDIKSKIIPVLIGGDMNCYSVARAFHEEYQVNSVVFGRYELLDTSNSKFIEFHAVPEVDTVACLTETVTNFANQHQDKTCIIMGCTDDYASLLMEVKHNLPKNCVAPYIDPELRDRLVDKDEFYRICDKYGILYPKTFSAKSVMKVDDLTAEKIGFEYPIIIKPSSSILYWKHPFEGMKKVYVAKSNIEASEILETIYKSGYDDVIILQDMIPGDDSYMRVLTAYSDQNGEVKMMCLGHVGLEEKAPRAVGNHAAIITEYNEELMMNIKAFLTDIHYVGFSNFDIKYDTRDNTYRAFEINLRQGRSNYYVTGAGQNLARYVVQDYIMNSLPEGCTMVQDVFYWRNVPDGVVFKYVQDKEFVAKAKELKRQKKDSISYRYGFDFKGNLKRFSYYWIHMYRYYSKFKKYS